MKKIILLSLSFWLCHGMQQESLKEKFFKALREGDIETVKKCVELDVAFINAWDKGCVYASQYVAETDPVVEDWISDYSMFLLKSSNSESQQQELKRREEREIKVQKAQALVQEAQALQEKKLEIFQWMLGVGVNTISEFLCQKQIIYDAIWSDNVDVVTAEKKLAWVMLASSSFWTISFSNELESLSSIISNIVNSISPTQTQQIIVDIWNFVELSNRLQEESAPKKQKTETVETDLKNHLQIAFIGRSFLKHFEQLLSGVYLDTVAQALDKDTMLTAMKTGSKAFEPLLSKMLLFSESEATTQLTSAFDNALNDYKLWYPQGALEFVQLKTMMGYAYRYDIMKRYKHFYNTQFYFTNI